MNKSVRLILIYTLRLLLPVFIGGAGKLSSQTVNFEMRYMSLGIGDGLPSSMCYALAQDSKGFVWVATAKGVSRFNGHHFKNYSYREGLSDIDVYGIKINRGATPEIYVFTATGGIYFLDMDDRFKPVPGNSLIMKYSKSFNIMDSHIGGPDDITLILANTRQDHHMYHFTSREAVPLDSVYLSGYETPTLFNYRNTSLVHMKYNGVFPDTLDWDKSVLGSQTGRAIVLNSRWAVLSKNTKGLALYCNGRLCQKEFDIGQVNHLMKISDNLFWAGGAFGIVEFRYSEKEGRFLKRQLINHKNVGCFSADENQGIWFSTLDEGIGYIPYPNIFWARGIKTTNIAVSPYWLYAGTRQNEVLCFDRNMHCATSYQTPSPVQSLYYNAIDGIVYCQRYMALKDGKLLHTYKPTWHTWNAEYDEQFYIGGSPVVMYKIRHRFPSTHRGTGFFTTEDRIRQACVHRGNIYIATERGLLRTGMQGEDSVSIPEFANKQITSVSSNGKYLLIGSGDNGASLLTNSGLLRLNQYVPAISNAVSKVMIDTSDILYIAGDKGLHILKYQPDQERQPFLIIGFYDQVNGLPSNEISDFAVRDGHLFVGCSMGVADIEMMPQLKHRIRVLPDSIISGSSRMKIAGLMTVPQDNHITVSWQALHFPSMKHIQFEYRLLPVNPEWQSTDALSKTFDNLPPGDYEFQLKAGSLYGVSSETMTVNIHIPYYFYQRLWFRIALYLVGLTIVALLIYLAFRRREKLMATEKHAARAETAALRSQMNPHFIFNALNNLQQMAYAGDFEQTNYYLTKFSDLMRKSLSYSRMELIPLSDEMAFISQYIELEQMRFDHSFSFFMDIETEEDTTGIMVPPLLIQPIVENSIKHGFKGIKYQGILKVVFKVKSDGLTIRVEDNGVGFDPEKQGNDGYGNMLVRERLEIISRQYHSKNAAAMRSCPHPDFVSGTLTEIDLPIFTARNI